MTFPRRARRFLTTVAAGSLVAAALATLSTPAEAAPARTVFTQPTPVYVGDARHGLVADDDVDIPAVGSVVPPALTFPRPTQIVNVKVSVVLEHERASDLELVVVGPTGEQVVLLNGAGGAVPTATTNLIFSDTATETLDEGEELPSIAEVQPASYGELAMTDPPVTGGTDLSVFDGTDAHGTWRLYVNDEEDHGSDTVGKVYEWAVLFELATTPYPSTIAVSGLGAVTDVNVSLHDFDSAFPADIDLLLVGPQGHQSLLMSDVGGGDHVSGVDLTLDDSAAAEVPATSTLTSGTFKPTNLYGGDDFPDAPVPSRIADLRVFNGTDPNGVWSLYAVDDTLGDISAIEGGWSLDIEWGLPDTTDVPDTTGPTGTVTLSSGSAYATSTAVNLSLTAADTGPGASGVRQMRFSNDGTAFSAWQPYAASAAWTLAGGKDGARTIHAQFADGAGNASALVSDTITLDTTAPTAAKIKPAKNATGVKPSAKVKVVASETLDKASVTKKTVTLKKSGTKIKATVSLTKGKSIVLTPKKALTKGTYKVTVTSQVTDLAGHAFDATSKPGTQTLRWAFKV